MKKLFAAVLAGALALSMSTAAFAKTTGGIFKPNQNGNTAITLEKGSDSLAQLFFTGDTDSDNFYFGVSTDWKDSAFESVFADSDAYLFAFSVNPSIPAASLPTLYIYNPFVDEEGATTISPSKVHIYEESNGVLRDATAYFSSATTSDGDSVFVARTRRPDTYILSEQKVKLPSADSGKTGKVKIVLQAQAADDQPTQKADSKALVLPSYAAK